MKTLLRPRILSLLGVAALLSGCATPEARLAQPSQVACYGTERLSHTLYLGSDREYHYFSWTHDFKSGAWKIPRYALELPGEFPRGRGEAFVRHKPNADLEIFGFKAAAQK